MQAAVARGAPALCLAALLAGCGEEPPAALIGAPDGPYRLSLALSPAAPMPGADTRLRFTVTHGAAQQPVSDLQIVHERALHTFIVARDFSSFAHLHHEDHAPRTDEDIAAGRFEFPYRFPHDGHYRVVSEFVHRDRSWSRRFDLAVGRGGTDTAAAADLSRTRRVGNYSATLTSSPAEPVAGHEAELVLELTGDGEPVTDLALWLGAEVHIAIWREDGEHFGHTHSYTPEMARMMAAHADGTHSAAMMMTMMAAPARLVYPGPRVPARHVFPTPGTYRLFCQLAPGGESVVFPFAVSVVADDGNVDTRVESIVPLAAASR